MDREGGGEPVGHRDPEAVGAALQGKEKKVEDRSRSYSNSFKKYQVGKSKQNIEANEEAAEPPLPPVANKKAELLTAGVFLQYLSVLEEACKNHGGELLGGPVATGCGVMVLN